MLTKANIPSKYPESPPTTGSPTSSFTENTETVPPFLFLEHDITEGQGYTEEEPEQPDEDEEEEDEGDFSGNDSDSDMVAAPQ
ncbi:hypothetical protein EMPS_04495 [Entomortierella parvispora]|uniref:Uncharacterized protein n=1 Tax=Entomortierella parvispora TaxID=205924 RepID=A0A9P3H9A1_9FUNG|nr:hypothetical protein EMPS_04495 [Entomortierella parvispora]